MFHLRLVEAVLLELDAGHLEVACHLAAGHLLGEFQGHLLEQPLGGLLAHGGALLLVAAGLERELDLLAQVLDGAEAQGGGHRVGRGRLDALSLRRREFHGDFRTAQVLALVDLRAGGLEDDGVADLLAGELGAQVLEHQAQDLALALVLGVRHHHERLGGLEVRVLRGTLHAHGGLADHAVEVRERAFDAARRAEAVAEATDLLVDVLVFHLGDGALDLDVLELGQGDVGDHLDVHGDGDLLAALHVELGGLLVHLGLGDGLELVVLQRLAVRVGEEAAAEVLADRLAEALLDERHRGRALAEAGDLHLAAGRGVGLVDARIHHRGGDGDLQALAGGSDVLDDDSGLGGHGAVRWLLGLK